jgi:hypothetical protein
MGLSAPSPVTPDVLVHFARGRTRGIREQTVHAGFRSSSGPFPFRPAEGPRRRRTSKEK